MIHDRQNYNNCSPIFQNMNNFKDIMNFLFNLVLKFFLTSFSADRNRCKSKISCALKWGWSQLCLRDVSFYHWLTSRRVISNWRWKVWSKSISLNYNTYLFILTYHWMAEIRRQADLKKGAKSNTVKVVTKLQLELSYDLYLALS